ncbi:MAG: prepilin-type N-terminal cleavage/methylation domain-containing protein [Candidatus Omnitrophica bacterium]|nr:prepilin-type N-terminal cleavage/methylation domain-containing protein [Candidatus Omnitrophota bacterium]
MKIKKQEGFTLVEVMVAAVIFVLMFVGMLLTFVKCLELNDLARNSSIATLEAKSRMEDIRNAVFTTVLGTYHNATFTVPGVTGMGVSYVDNTVVDLLEITVVVCWQQKNGRIIGEDTNLNGQLDGGEDTNGNGRLDSTVEIISYMYNI